MSTISNLKIAIAGALLAVAATACGTATAGSSPDETPVQTPRGSQGHIEPPRVVDGLDLVRQAIVE